MLYHPSKISGKLHAATRDPAARFPFNVIHRVSRVDLCEGTRMEVGQTHLLTRLQVRAADRTMLGFAKLFPLGSQPSFFLANGDALHHIRFTRRRLMPHLEIDSESLPLTLQLEGKRRVFECPFVQCWHHDYQNHLSFAVKEDMLMPGLAVAYYLFNCKGH